MSRSSNGDVTTVSTNGLPNSSPNSLTTAGPIHKGRHGPEVALVRSLLTRVLARDSDGPRLPPAADESLFDPGLEFAVKTFQQNRGLLTDGIVGPQTVQQLESARWQFGDRTLLLTVGHWMRGDDVAALQERMVVLGLHAGPVDGIFGPGTERSLRELQRGLGLPVDGICGVTTFQALGALGRSVVGGDAWALRSRGRVAMAGVSLTGKTVVLDAGLDESSFDISYDVVARLAEQLESVGAKVRLTRDRGQALISTRDRAALAESESADLVISLLTETHPSTRASGVSTYYWGGGRVGQHSETGHRLAGLIQREVVARTGVVDCRSHPCSYDLVRLTRMPAVIVSMGYLTNPEDARRLATSQFRETMAEAVLFAVQRLYLAEEDAKTGTLNVRDVENFARQR